MAWTVPGYSPSEVDAAGGSLVASPRANWRDLMVINHWRSSHAFPLNTFQVGLRERARSVNNDSIVAQRIKRLSSIELKLQRYNWLRLSDMQDMGGCRAVVRNPRHVYQVVDRYNSSGIKHNFDDQYDYIATTKRSGYRGYHLIYKYYSDRKQTYNGLKIEV